MCPTRIMSKPAKSTYIISNFRYLIWIDTYKIDPINLEYLSLDIGSPSFFFIIFEESMITQSTNFSSILSMEWDKLGVTPLGVLEIFIPSIIFAFF